MKATGIQVAPTPVYATGSLAELAPLVSGRPRRMMTLLAAVGRSTNIRLINRRFFARLFLRLSTKTMA